MWKSASTHAAGRGLDVTIEAKPVTEAEKELSDWDIVMLGPQVRHMLKALQKNANGTPIEVINMRSYGLIDSKAALDDGLKALNK